MTVEIITPSRLHFGFLDVTKDNYHRFGGIGLALDYPRVRLKIHESDELRVEGVDSGRVRNYFREILAKTEFLGAEVIVEESIPSHKGLGSGTAITMAGLEGLKELYGFDVDLEKKAIELGRGKRSGVGIKAAMAGGFIIELGNSEDDMRKQVLLQQDFPKEWRFLLVIPEDSGLYGEEEEKAFNELDFQREISGEVCRHTLMSLIPSFKKRNLSRFGEALTRIQESVGEYFKEVQGGTFATEEANRFFNNLDSFEEKAFGFGQSSWGPTFFFLTHNKYVSELENEVKEYLGEFKGKYDTLVTKSNNRGTKVS